MELMDGMGSRRGALKQLKTQSEEGMANAVLTEDEEPLSPATRLFLQPRLSCYIVAVIGSGKRVDVDVIKKGLEDTLLRHPRFTSIQVLDERKGSGQHKWVRTNVVLENHLVIPDLDPEMESPDKFVEDYTSDLTKTTLDMSKPLWELHILNVPTAEAEATAIFRIHHSLGDGISLISLLLACTRKTTEPNSLPSMPERRKAVSRKGGFVLRFLMSIWWFMRLVWRSVVDIWLFLATGACYKDSETPIKGTEGVGSRPKRIVHCTLSLDDVKMVKTAMDSTINDVFLGVTSAGLSRYLNRRHRHGKDKAVDIEKQSLPSNIRLRAAVFVNIRPTPGVHALHDVMEKDKMDIKWGNRFGYVLLPFFVGQRDDPLDYVRKAKAIADQKKLSLEAFFTFSFSTVIINAMGIKAAADLAYKVLSNTTMSFSNIVGPTEEVSLCGHPMVYLAPSVYGHPHALTVHFVSYLNKVKMVLAVDENVVPDPHQLCADLADSLRLIKDAVIARQ
ncbi:hypothetical protein AAC387_Pa12g1876 [Persea americana]